MKYNRIGLHARNPDELYRVMNIPGVDVIEIKPHGFNRDEKTALYFYDGKKFTPNHSFLSELKKISDNKDIQFQLHTPFETHVNTKHEMGLCQAIESHHDLILSKYELYGNINKEYGILDNITTHSAAFRLNKKDICSVKDALNLGVKLYGEIDKLIKINDFKFNLGIENVVKPKEDYGAVGYTPRQIDMLMGNTSNLGITIDTGHRNLNDEMSIAKLFSYGEVVNVHFHSNSGIASKKGFNDDEHILATGQNLPHYGRFIKSFRRFGMPIILEIFKLKPLSDDDISSYIKNLRHEIEKS